MFAYPTCFSPWRFESFLSPIRVSFLCCLMFSARSVYSNGENPVFFIFVHPSRGSVRLKCHKFCCWEMKTRSLIRSVLLSGVRLSHVNNTCKEEMGVGNCKKCSLNRFVSLSGVRLSNIDCSLQPVISVHINPHTVASLRGFPLPPSVLLPDAL